MIKQRQSQIKKAVVIGMALQGAIGFVFGGLQPAFSQNNVSTPAQGQQILKLYGKADVLATSCSDAGLSMSAKKLPALVENVRYQSPAFYAGIAKNDKVLSGNLDLKDKPLSFSLVIERRGQKHSVCFEEEPRWDLQSNKDDKKRNLPLLSAMPGSSDGFTPRSQRGSVPEERTRGLPIPEQNISGLPVPEEKTRGLPIPEQKISGLPIPEERTRNLPVPEDNVTLKDRNGKYKPGVPRVTTMPGIPSEFSPAEPRGVVPVHISQPRTQDLSVPEDPITFKGKRNKYDPGVPETSSKKNKDLIATTGIGIPNLSSRNPGPDNGRPRWRLRSTTLETVIQTAHNPPDHNPNLHGHVGPEPNPNDHNPNPNDHNPNPHGHITPEPGPGHEPNPLPPPFNFPTPTSHHPPFTPPGPGPEPPIPNIFNNGGFNPPGSMPPVIGTGGGGGAGGGGGSGGGGGASVNAGNVGQNWNPVTEKFQIWNGQDKNSDMRQAEKNDTNSLAQDQPGTGRGSHFQWGFGLGSESTQKQAQQTNSDMQSGSPFTVEGTNLDMDKNLFQWAQMSRTDGAQAGTEILWLRRNETVAPFQIGRPSDDSLSAGSWIQGGVSGGGGCGGGSCKGVSGRPVTNQAMTAAKMYSQAAGSQMAGDPKAKTNQARTNQMGNQCSNASSAGEDTIECMINALDGMTLTLINVANEDAGSPCAADQISKTYSNSVWMVMKMYKACFLPMAILFLLPGAIITNTKTLISYGILGSGNDEDSASPFAGIMRATIAIFLIPATQMVVSYMIDVGNSLQYSCQPYVNIPLIVMWAEEQVQIFSANQQGNPIKNLPNVPFAPWNGKFAGMPKGGAVLEQISGLDAALSELANQCMHILSEGLTIAHAFQVVMICYLFLIGPIAAAFFAWPSAGKDLFRKAFATWVDGVVILSLWKFWWNVVLICMTVRCESGALNPFDPFEVYYLVAFLCILMTVPFNPFDFKPGDIVSGALEKAQQVAAKVAQSGKGGGSGGGGGKGSPGPGGGGG